MATPSVDDFRARVHQRSVDPRQAWQTCDGFATNEWELAHPAMKEWCDEWAAEDPTRSWPVYVIGPRPLIMTMAGLDVTETMRVFVSECEERRCGVGGHGAGSGPVVELWKQCRERLGMATGHLGNHLCEPQNKDLALLFISRLWLSFFSNCDKPGTVAFLDKLQRLHLAPTSRGFIVVKPNHRFLNVPAILNTLNLSGCSGFVRLKKIGNDECRGWTGDWQAIQSRTVVLWRRLQTIFDNEQMVNDAVGHNYLVDHWFPHAPKPPKTALVPGEGPSTAPSWNELWEVTEAIQCTLLLEGPGYHAFKRRKRRADLVLEKRKATASTSTTTPTANAPVDNDADDDVTDDEIDHEKIAKFEEAKKARAQEAEEAERVRLRLVKKKEKSKRHKLSKKKGNASETANPNNGETSSSKTSTQPTQAPQTLTSTTAARQQPADSANPSANKKSKGKGKATDNANAQADGFKTAAKPDSVSKSQMEKSQATDGNKERSTTPDVKPEPSYHEIPGTERNARSWVIKQGEHWFRIEQFDRKNPAHRHKDKLAWMNLSCVITRLTPAPPLKDRKKPDNYHDALDLTHSIDTAECPPRVIRDVAEWDDSKRQTVSSTTLADIARLRTCQDLTRTGLEDNNALPPKETSNTTSSTSQSGKTQYQAQVEPSQSETSGSLGDNGENIDTQPVRLASYFKDIKKANSKSNVAPHNVAGASQKDNALLAKEVKISKVAAGTAKVISNAVSATPGVTTNENIRPTTAVAHHLDDAQSVNKTKGGKEAATGTASGTPPAVPAHENDSAAKTKDQATPASIPTATPSGTTSPVDKGKGKATTSTASGVPPIIASSQRGTSAAQNRSQHAPVAVPVASGLVNAQAVDKGKGKATTGIVTTSAPIASPQRSTSAAQNTNPVVPVNPRVASLSGRAQPAPNASSNASSTKSPNKGEKKHKRIATIVDYFNNIDESSDYSLPAAPKVKPQDKDTVHNVTAASSSSTAQQHSTSTAKGKAKDTARNIAGASGSSTHQQNTSNAKGKAKAASTSAPTASSSKKTQPAPNKDNKDTTNKKAATPATSGSSSANKTQAKPSTSTADTDVPTKRTSTEKNLAKKERRKARKAEQEMAELASEQLLASEAARVAKEKQDMRDAADPEMPALLAQKAMLEKQIAEIQEQADKEEAQRAEMSKANEKAKNAVLAILAKTWDDDAPADTTEAVAPPAPPVIVSSSHETSTTPAPDTEGITSDNPGEATTPAATGEPSGDSAAKCDNTRHGYQPADKATTPGMEKPTCSASGRPGSGLENSPPEVGTSSAGIQEADQTGSSQACEALSEDLRVQAELATAYERRHRRFLAAAGPNWDPEAMYNHSHRGTGRSRSVTARGRPRWV
ncbi:hypothetical protein OQA88_8938 [Cercophora sp. LCS_1]